jgi:hypothetical protein
VHGAAYDTNIADPEDAYAVHAKAGFAPLVKPDKWIALQ